MKHKKIYIFIILTMFSLFLIGCSKEKTYKITFNANNGDSLEPVILKENEKLKLPIVEKEGYIFDTWLLNGESFNDNTVITKNIKLEASWIKDIKINKGDVAYIVTFKYDNNRPDLYINVFENEKLTKPIDPVKANHKFIGWYLNDVKYDFNSKLVNHLILVAKYEHNDPSKRGNTNNNTQSTSKHIDIQSISIANNPMSVNYTSTSKINVIFTPYNATNKTLTYTSSNPAVVSVDENGIVRANSKTESYAIITVTTSNGKTATVRVNATHYLTKIEINSINLKPDFLSFDGEYKDNTYKIDYVNGADKTTIQWYVLGESGYDLDSCDNKETCTIRTTNDTPPTYKIVTLVAEVLSTSGKIIKTERKIGLEGLFELTYSNNEMLPNIVELKKGSSLNFKSKNEKVRNFSPYNVDSGIQIDAHSSNFYKVTCKNDAEVNRINQAQFVTNAKQYATLQVRCIN